MSWFPNWRGRRLSPLLKVSRLPPSNLLPFIHFFYRPRQQKKTPWLSFKGRSLTIARSTVACFDTYDPLNAMQARHPDLSTALAIIKAGSESLTMPRMVDPEDMNNTPPSNPELHQPARIGAAATPPSSHLPKDLLLDEVEMHRPDFRPSLMLFGPDSDDDKINRFSPIRDEDSQIGDINHEDSSDPSWSNAEKPESQRNKENRTLSSRKKNPKHTAEADAIQTYDSDSSPLHTQAAQRRASKPRSHQDREIKENPLASTQLKPSQRRSQESNERRGTNSYSSSDTPIPTREVDDVEEEEFQGTETRSLRKRTIQQTHPYKFDQVQHNFITSKGKVAQAGEVEEVIQDKISSTQKQNPRKKVKTSNGSNLNKSKTTKTKNQDKQRRSGSFLSALESSTAEPDLEKATLQIWLDGFNAGAAPATLSDFKNVDQLVDFMTDAWTWKFDKQQAFSYAIASFPWLNDEANVLIRRGMDNSYQKLIQEVEGAPVWAQDGDKAKCQVKITVYVQPTK